MNLKYLNLTMLDRYYNKDKGNIIFFTSKDYTGIVAPEGIYLFDHSEMKIIPDYNEVDPPDLVVRILNKVVLNQDKMIDINFGNKISYESNNSKYNYERLVYDNTYKFNNLIIQKLFDKHNLKHIVKYYILPNAINNYPLLLIYENDKLHLILAPFN